MPSQQDIKQRITSVTGTSKITRAMELVAALVGAVAAPNDADCLPSKFLCWW